MTGFTGLGSLPGDTLNLNLWMDCQCEPEEKPIEVDAVLDEESKEGPDDELSASRHAKPVAPVEAVPEDTRVRAVSFDIEQPVVSPLQESRANSSKWSLVKPS